MFRLNNKINPRNFFEINATLSLRLEKAFTESNSAIFFALNALSKSDDWQLFKFIEQMFELPEEEIQAGRTTILKSIFLRKPVFEKKVTVEKNFTFSKTLANNPLYNVNSIDGDIFFQDEFNDSVPALLQIYPIDGNKWCLPTLIEATEELVQQKGLKNLNRFTIRVINQLIEQDRELFLKIGISNENVLIPLYSDLVLDKFIDRRVVITINKYDCPSKYIIFPHVPSKTRLFREAEITFIAVLSQ